MANLMEETEKDLVNKQLNNETMRRQQEILTKLLESEKAEREREQDEQRKSNEAKNQELSNPNQYSEYRKQKEKEIEDKRLRDRQIRNIKAEIERLKDKIKDLKKMDTQLLTERVSVLKN